MGAEAGADGSVAPDHFVLCSLLTRRSPAGPAAQVGVTVFDVAETPVPRALVAVTVKK